MSAGANSKMENRNWKRWNKSNDSSGFYHFVGAGLVILGLLAEPAFHFPQSLAYTICAAGLISMLYALIIQMLSLWRNASREASEKNKEYDAKAEAANAYLFGTKTSGEQK